MCREFKERQCTEKREAVGEGKTQVVLARLGNNNDVAFCREPANPLGMKLHNST
jgi:hypothetical protein